MTQEEKAMAYDEAIKRAKEINNEKKAQPFDVMLKVFPELKESEDERVRKELLNYCKNRAEKYPNDPKYKNISAWIAWLEKQVSPILSNSSSIGKNFNYENANIQQKDFAPKPQRMVAAEAKEALYGKPEEQPKKLSLGKTVIEINSVRHRLVLDTIDAEQACKECSLRALCDSISGELLENTRVGLCVPFTMIGEQAHFIMEK